MRIYIVEDDLSVINILEAGHYSGRFFHIG